MKDFFGTIGTFILVLLLVVGLGVGGSFLSFKLYEYFNPKYTAVQNKTFHESQQYNDGMVRDLENLEMEYKQADPAGKQALKPIIIHRFEIYPREKMTPDERDFYNSLNQ